MSMKWEIAKSIYNKRINKQEINIFKPKMTSNATSNFPLRINYARTQLCSDWSKGGNSGSTMRPENCFRITSKFYTTACKSTPAACVGFLNFNTEQERSNAWKAFHTKFVRFCIMIDESIKLVPYMDDYTEPWTDERFKQYFGLTDIEWQLIDTVIKD